jgi:hypothetical protein
MCKNLQGFGDEMSRPGRKYDRNGESKTITEWADSIGITRDALYARIHRGWNLEKALQVPTTKSYRNNNAYLVAVLSSWRGARKSKKHEPLDLVSILRQFPSNRAFPISDYKQGLNNFSLVLSNCGLIEKDHMDGRKVWWWRTTPKWSNLMAYLEAA